MKLLRFLLPFLFLLPGALQAEITLSALFGDHVVLQRDAPVPVWGTAKRGKR